MAELSPRDFENSGRDKRAHFRFQRDVPSCRSGWTLRAQQPGAKGREPKRVCIPLSLRFRSPGSEAGCADGTREGFTGRTLHPDIAGCSGAWDVPGIHTENPGEAPACPGLATYETRVPRCDRGAGNDGRKRALP